jgi:GTP-binding protein Era
MQCTGDRRCGTVALVGVPNSGKSTLMNSLIGDKLSIVSSKAQTTRRAVKGVLTCGDSQVVFVDTPGFCSPRSSLERAVLSNFSASCIGADVLLLLIDARHNTFTSTKRFLDMYSGHGSKLSLAFNKIDLIKKEKLLPLADSFAKYLCISDIFMISAKKQQGLDDLKAYLFSNLPERPWLFEEQEKTDLSLKFRLSEVTREKLFNLLEDEVPYQLYVETEALFEKAKKITIFQSIVVMKSSQKGIILGKAASFIKKVKYFSIADMEAITSKKIDLRLFVKVKEKWTEKMEHLRNAEIY